MEDNARVGIQTRNITFCIFPSDTALRSLSNDRWLFNFVYNHRSQRTSAYSFRRSSHCDCTTNRRTANTSSTETCYPNGPKVITTAKKFQDGGAVLSFRSCRMHRTCYIEFLSCFSSLAAIYPSFTRRLPRKGLARLHCRQAIPRILYTCTHIYIYKGRPTYRSGPPTSFCLVYAYIKRPPIGIIAVGGGGGE